MRMDLGGDRRRGGESVSVLYFNNTEEGTHQGTVSLMPLPSPALWPKVLVLCCADPAFCTDLNKGVAVAKPALTKAPPHWLGSHCCLLYPFLFGQGETLASEAFHPPPGIDPRWVSVFCQPLFWNWGGCIPESIYCLSIFLQKDAERGVRSPVLAALPQAHSQALAGRRLVLQIRGPKGCPGCRVRMHCALLPLQCTAGISVPRRQGPGRAARPGNVESRAEEGEGLQSCALESDSLNSNGGSGR